MLTHIEAKAQVKTIPVQPSTIVTNRFAKAKLRARVIRQFWKILHGETGSHLKTYRILRELRRKYLQTLGRTMLTKVAKVDGRYFWRMGVPGYPSEATYTMHTNEAMRFLPEKPRQGLGTLFFAITKKCPMNCEHCFEWDRLHKPEVLATKDIVKVVHRYQDYGTTQILLSGGEPMMRYEDILTVLEAAKSGTDFWIITSGLRLNEERAQGLKAAGLTGVIVSLDHYESEPHDQFRGYPGAYNAAIEAVVSANAAGLVTNLFLTTTKAFVREDHLENYMKLAKRLGVSFVQFIEPRASGRYVGQDVELGPEEIEILEQFHLKYNESPDYADYPIINYLGFHQRRVGCFGAGNRFFYIDSSGDGHVCPFCSHAAGSALELSAEEMIEKLGQRPCVSFGLNDSI